VAEHDPVEVPGQDRVQRRAGGCAIADAEADDAVRAEAARRAHQPVEPARAAAVAADVEGEVGQHQRARRRVLEHHLVHERRAAEQAHRDLAAPGRGLRLVEHGVEAQVLALLGQAGRAAHARLRVDAGVVAEIEVMDLARPHDPADRAQAVEGRAYRVVQGDG
jgi:hypothetical protein